MSTTRYLTPAMAELWSEPTKFETWLLVEKAVARVQGKLGIIPKSAAAKIQHATFKIKEIERFEKQTNHDVIAFTRSVARSVGAAGKYVHYGLTSYDVVDTALALRCIKGLNYIDQALAELHKTIAGLAKRYKWTPMMGRTHGVHAEPITFGLKCLSWLSEIERGQKRVKIARDQIAYGKLSGTVGAYTQLTPAVENQVMKILGLKVEPVSTQVIPRDRHAFLLSTLALIATGLERIATEIRNLQRTEINELAEPFASGQAGSSAMPHKQNPIICERICSLARVIRAYAAAAYENIPLWHERDLTNSAAERIIIPESFILLHYSLVQLNKVLAGLVVKPEQMTKNLKISGETFFSQALLLALINKGMDRTRAYQLVQELAFQATSTNSTLSAEARRHPTVRKHLTETELQRVFNLPDLLKNINQVYRRLFNRK
uniref:Adenylosuccinate lyase n=1 Tax=candidate division WOR-3 bacterium TaxID=2052148 RepID=A0A7V3PTQ2_UNCW3